MPKQPKVSRDEAAKLLYFSAEVPQPDDLISRIRAIIRLREVPSYESGIAFLPSLLLRLLGKGCSPQP